jgi:nucleotide-binding universal stress UspA family protein
MIDAMTPPVVVLYDGSTFSKRAFPWAVEIARRTSSPLHIVRAHVSGVAAAGVRRDLDKVAKKLAAPDVPVSPVLLEQSTPVPRLNEYVRQANAAWVVMATHGRGGFSRFWLGSTATGMLRESSAPIFLLPGKARQTSSSLTHIAAAMDGSPLSQLILTPVSRLAHAFNAKVTLVTLISPFEIEEKVHEAAFGDPVLQQDAAPNAFIHGNLAREVTRLGAEGLHVQSLVRPTTDPVAPGLLNASADLGAEVLALSTHGLGFWSRAAFGSIADKVIRTSTMPLLIYNPPLDSYVPS